MCLLASYRLTTDNLHKIVIRELGLYWEEEPLTI